MWSRILTGALAVGCVVIGVGLLLGGKGHVQSPAPKVELPTIALPATHRVANAVAQEMLDRRMDELDLRSATLEEAIETIAAQTHANIAVHWTILEANNVLRTTPVHLHLWNVTVRTALRVLLDLQAGYLTFSFEPDDDVIIVSDADELRHYAVVTAYNVRDLLQVLHDTSQPSQQDPRNTIVKLIEDTVAPDSWRDAGGSEGIISELGGVLVVSQTPDNHQKIAELLQKVREQVIHR